MKNLKFKDILVFRNKDSFNFSQIQDFLVVLLDDCCFIVNFMIQSVSCLVIFVTE